MVKKFESRRAFKIFMMCLGLDVEDPELKETPRRVADMYGTLLSGKGVDIKKFFARTLPTTHTEMTVIEAIEFVSLCPHHLLPWFGKTRIAVIPNNKIVGFSKYPSAVRALARRPMLQETFTSTLADTIDECLAPIGVMVIVQAIHTCTVVPGRYDFDTGTVQKPMCTVTTSALRGLFLHDLPDYSYSSIAARNEALLLMGLKEV